MLQEADAWRIKQKLHFHVDTMLQLHLSMQQEVDVCLQNCTSNRRSDVLWKAENKLSYSHSFLFGGGQFSPLFLLRRAIVFIRQMKQKSEKRDEQGKRVVDALAVALYALLNLLETPVLQQN